MNLSQTPTLASPISPPTKDQASPLLSTDALDVVAEEHHEAKKVEAEQAQGPVIGDPPSCSS